MDTKDCFFTENYKNAFITCCQNRTTKTQEVTYQVDGFNGTAKTVIGAKRIITQYLRENPLKWTITRHHRALPLYCTIHRTRALDVWDKMTIDYVMSSLFFVLQVPSTTLSYTLNTTEFAQSILAVYDNSNPKIADSVKLLESL